jgi:small subunit ribosomal protein S14
MENWRFGMGIMKHLLEKEKNRRKLTNKYEFKKLFLKSILSNCDLPITFRWKAGLKLSELPKDSSKIRLTNRCILTSRSRGIYSAFRISRIELRNLSAAGKISGLKKSSW